MLSPLRAVSRFACLALLTAGGLALAQINFDVSRLDVNSSSGSLVVGTGEILPVGAVRFSLAGDYENNPYRYYDASGLIGSVISDRYTVHVVGGFAPVDWLELGMDIPIIASQSGVEIQIAGLPAPIRRGLGSPTGSVRAALASQAKGAFADVAFQMGVKVPLGTDGSFARDATIGLSPKLMIGHALEWARAGLELGLKWRPTTITGVNNTGDPAVDDIGNSLLVAAVITTGPKNGLRGEVSGRSYVTFNGSVGSVELLGGLRYPIASNMELYALAGPGLGQAPGTPAFRVMVGAAFGNGAGILGTPTGDAAAPATTAPAESPAPALPPEIIPQLPQIPEIPQIPQVPVPTYPPSYPPAQPQPTYSPPPDTAPQPSYPPPAPSYPPPAPAQPPPDEEPPPSYQTFPTGG